MKPTMKVGMKGTTLFLPLLCVLTACLKPTQPVVLHTLQALAAAREAAPAATALEVMPVRLPESLQRTQMVSTQGPGVLRISETHRWGNGLDEDFRRVLVANLSALLGSDAVVPHPYGDRVKAATRLEVDVQRLEGRPGGTLQLRASWMLVPAAGGPAILLRRSSLDETVPGAGMEDLAAAHSRILERFSREIAAAVPAGTTGK